MLLYSGKAKSIHADGDDYVIMQFRDDTSAFNGEVIKQLADKGKTNNAFNAFIMQLLEARGIATHFDKVLDDNRTRVKNLNMIPIECVVRNAAAGSLAKRLGLDEGRALTPPVFELFYKDDKLGDPMLSASAAVALGFATKDELDFMQTTSLKINEILSQTFDDAGLLLVDFKLEFGRFKGKILLGDEFSPDGCRVWDKATGKKLDKDRFRQNLGDVVESYTEIAKRLGAV